MKACIDKKFIVILGILTLLSITNIACTKANNNIAAMATDTTATDNTNDDKLQGKSHSFLQFKKDTLKPKPPAGDTPRLYLALGDSYTIGQSVPLDESFPAQTVAVLKNDGINLGEPQYIATTGWSTIALQNAIGQQNPKGPYEAVTLLIGVNDQYQHLPVTEYPTRFSQLLQKAIQLAGNRISRVFVLSIPDYSVTPFGGGDTTIRNQINEYNAINKQITLANNIAYIDITPISRLAAEDPTLTANDGLHPSGKQYALWVEQLAPVMEKALK